MNELKRATEPDVLMHVDRIRSDAARGIHYYQRTDDEGRVTYWRITRVSKEEFDTMGGTRAANP